jgi:hypothetical protein
MTALRRQRVGARPVTDAVMVSWHLRPPTKTMLHEQLPVEHAYRSVTHRARRADHVGDAAERPSRSKPMGPG